MIQIPLQIRLKESATFVSYYAGHNQEAVQAVKGLCSKGAERFIYLWGSTGVGRTHLLQAAAHGAREAGDTAIYLPCQEINAFTPDSLSDLEQVGLICLDDVDCLLGNPLWEAALFHLFNRISDGESRLLMSAKCAPRALPVQLEDLKSRLSWGAVYQLHSLSDDEKVEALQVRAGYCGLQLEKGVAQFLMRHIDRQPSELFHALEYLDKSSLAEQRRLTIPFVKKALGI